MSRQTGNAWSPLGSAYQEQRTRGHRLVGTQKWEFGGLHPVHIPYSHDFTSRNTPRESQGREIVNVSRVFAIINT
jgi:hypothetical protein